MTLAEWTAIVAKANALLPDNRRGSAWTKAWYEELSDFDVDRVRAAVKLAMAEIRGGGLQGPDILRALGVGHDPQGERYDDLAFFDVLWMETWKMRETLGWARTPPMLTEWQSWMIAELDGWVQMGAILLADLPTRRAQVRDAFLGRRAARRRRGLPLDDAVGLTDGQKRLLRPPAELLALVKPLEEEQQSQFSDYAENVRGMLNRYAEQVRLEEESKAAAERTAEAAKDANSRLDAWPGVPEDDAADEGDAGPK